MDRSLISIILTTYNRADLVGRAIRSVLQNTYDNLELLIIDDASTDATETILSQFKDRRIHYVKMIKNGGVLRARNRGFEMARGQYITILDDDDELTSDALETVITEFEKAENQDISILWFDCIDVEDQKVSGTILSTGGIISYDDYLCGLPGDFWITFRRKVLEGNRFNEELRAHESLLWARIHRVFKARHVSKILCKKYRKHGGERLSDLQVRLKQLNETTLALKLFISEFGPDLARINPDRYGKRLAYLGLNQMAINEFKAGRHSIATSLKHRFSFKYLIFYFLSFFLSSNQVIHLMKWQES